MYFGGGFTYGNVNPYNSDAHGLVFARCDTSEMLSPVSSKSYYTIKNHATEKRFIYGSAYEDPLSFETEIFVCDGALTESQSREVCRLLFNANEYRWLKLKDDTWNGIHLNCVMRLIEKIYGGDGSSDGVIGYKISVLCDAPFAWEDEDQVDCVLLPFGDAVSYVLNNRSDYEGYTYPSVTISKNVSDRFDLREYEESYEEDQLFSPSAVKIYDKENRSFVLDANKKFYISKPGFDRYLYIENSPIANCVFFDGDGDFGVSSAVIEVDLSDYSGNATDKIAYVVTNESSSI